MARRFYWEIVCAPPPHAGLVQSGQRDYISVDDLPRVHSSVAVTMFGSITMDLTGRVTAVAPWADGVYTQITVLGGLATPGTSPPPPPATTPPTRLFTHYDTVGNSGSTPTALYTDTIAAGTLAADGDVLELMYAGTFTMRALETLQLVLTFGGILFFDTGALTLSLSSTWTIYATIIRVGANTARCSATLSTEGAALAAYTGYAELTRALSSNQDMILNGVAAGAGATDNDITANMAYIEKYPAS